MRKSIHHIWMRFGELLTFFCLTVVTADHQTLQGQVSGTTPQVQPVTNSPEYKNASRAAESIDNNSKPKAYAPYPWNAKKPFLWLGYKEKELGKYTLDLDELKGRIDDDGNRLRIRNDREKLAQLSQIENRIAEENFDALNDLVGAVDLGTFFTRNNRPDIAKLWTQWSLSENNAGLHGSNMEELHKFIGNIIRCLSESQRYHVQFSRSSKFSNDVPLGADGTPMNKQDAAVFWQFDNSAAVSRAIARLYDSLHKAEAEAVEQGLLRDGPQE